MNAIRRTGDAEPASGLPARAGRRSADVLRGVVVAAVLAASAPLAASAATLTWGTSGTGGSGTWNTSNNGWWTGAAQANWNNATPDAAVFAGTAGTVTLAFSGTTTVATGVTGTIESRLTGAGNFTKSGSGVLRLTNMANNFTGTITASGGVLEMDVIPNSSNRIAFTAGTLGFGSMTALGTGTVTFSGNATLRATVTGTGWDFVDASGSLDITATGENQFSINLLSLAGLPDTTGSVSDFDATSSSKFLIAEFDGGITGWDPTKFSVRTTATNGTGGFTNTLDGGSFTVARGDMVGGSATQIDVVYTAVPEPGTPAAAVIGLVAAAWAARRRRGQGATSRHMSVASSRR